MYTHAPDDYVRPFCRVMAGQDVLPFGTCQHDVVVRNESVHAFNASDWRVNNPGHVLVIPNLHYENLYELPFDVGASIQAVVRNIALALKQSYGCDGVSTVQQNETAGNQDVWHYHVHVFPRYVGDDIYRSPKRQTTPEERSHTPKKCARCWQR